MTAHAFKCLFLCFKKLCGIIVVFFTLQVILILPSAVQIFRDISKGWCCVVMMLPLRTLIVWFCSSVAVCTSACDTVFIFWSCRESLLLFQILSSKAFINIMCCGPSSLNCGHFASVSFLSLRIPYVSLSILFASFLFL
jgi:hypothetical protein